ncbi:MAG: hypothetical protein ACXWFZ_13605, partial [Nitrososphaeraceae archaeon]
SNNTYNNEIINQYQRNHQTNTNTTTTTTTSIINEIINKNMDTFLKSIEFAQKFYFDVVQSYYDYIIKINKLSDK